MQMGTTYMSILTEKTTKKNGRKWSNISVKKYHQRPTLGVRSGSENWEPHVEAIQFRFPVIKVDMAARTMLYSAYSTARGKRDLQGAGEACGFELFEWDARIVHIGIVRRIGVNDKCVAIACKSKVVDFTPLTEK